MGISNQLQNKSDGLRVKAEANAEQGRKLLQVLDVIFVSIRGRLLVWQRFDRTQIIFPFRKKNMVISTESMT